MVPFKPFHIAQIQKAQAKAPRLAIGCQAQEPIRNFIILIAWQTLIAIAGLTDPKRQVS